MTYFQYVALAYAVFFVVLAWDFALSLIHI